MNEGILVAHPLKHHAFHLAAGCQRSGRHTVRLLTPLYRKGLGSVVARFPGAIGRKARGYVSSRLDRRAVEAPASWQLRRLLAQNGDLDRFCRQYDRYVATRVADGHFNPKVLVTLQDYMPLTVDAAKRRGCIIWSDQISNQSPDALARVARHHSVCGSELKDDLNQVENRRVLSVADVVTVPSSYALSGVSELLSITCDTHIVPYGAETVRFAKPRRRGGVAIIAARANSVRKGGPAFIEALARCASELLALAAVDGIEVRIVGEFDTATARALGRVSLPHQIKVLAGAVPHCDMSRFLSEADIFVMPALSESMSLMCIEAMQAGLPCVITAYCGVDAFRDGEYGVEIGDSSVEIERGLRMAFANRHHWAAWGESACRAARALSWDAYEKRIATIAAELA